MLDDTTSLPTIAINNLTKGIGAIIEPALVPLEGSAEDSNAQRAPERAKGIKSRSRSVTRSVGIMILQHSRTGVSKPYKSKGNNGRTIYVDEI